MSAKTPYDRARVEASQIRKALNEVVTAIRSPRCLLQWKAADNGDMLAVWVTENCVGEDVTNVSELQRRMDALAKRWGNDIMRSRRGGTIQIELPTLAAKGANNGQASANQVGNNGVATTTPQAVRQPE